MSILSDEIALDPSGKGYASLLPNQPGQVVNLLNEKTEVTVGTISRTDLTTWSASTGMRAVIEDIANDTQSPLRSSALAILDVLKGSSEGIDLSKASNMAILNAWEGAGVLSPENKASMLALAEHLVSRAEKLGLPYITEELLRNR